MSLESLPQSIRYRLDFLSECRLVPNATSFQVSTSFAVSFQSPSG